MKRSEDTFVLTPEFGVRLRNLRLKTDLTQSVLPAIRSDVFNVAAPIGP
jgi:hypothetical protein